MSTDSRHTVVVEEFTALRKNSLRGFAKIRLPWAVGIDLRSARGWDYAKLLQRAAGDSGRLRQIQAARGYKVGWLYFALRDAAGKRA